MNKPLLYIHIPKTAGVSIQNSGLVKKSHWKNHKRAIDIKNLSDFYSFAFIRNPYEKVLSSFNFYLNNEIRGNKSHKKIIKKLNTFENMILNYELVSNQILEHFKYTQSDYICDKNGKIIIDYWDYFNNINSGINVMLKRIDKSTITLPIINKTPHNNWKNFYNDNLAEIVYGHWEKDFINFKFDKNSYKK
jgi:chondroitin 4-sulfotransferase 11